MSLFITATDTGVGKTLVSGGITYALRERGLDVGCWKPLQSGELAHDPAGDAMRLKNLADLPDTAEQICGWSFAEPLAPRLAAERAGVALHRRDLLAKYEEVRQLHDYLLIEGAGGLAVPFTADTRVVDLARDLGHPLLLIARAGLGTVNHTVLTVNYAEQNGLNVRGVILSGGGRPDAEISEPFNAAYIEEYTGVPVLGHVPWLGSDPTLEQIRETVEHTVDIDRIARYLFGGD
ncbi:dethiobiotin synthase [Tumebacillus permanentifrigoris]|uniref:ATP-dependent dethiobiotin synthetase BioD n=1 Tax=Tumebacillus permanentifrigoris TaxID=378543 RepID=A0A316DAF2_9BACL|nr:dethiobiotin synthase [Tumebacillus permanentifrigoris]PWK13792.1 dethiobiotin synthase [Tumebacillus permanentifrigoris]